MKMKKLLTILLAASIVAGSAQVPGLTMQVQAAQVQTQESAGSATATYNGKSVFWQANLRLVLTPMRMERAKHTMCRLQ